MMTKASKKLGPCSDTGKLHWASYGAGPVAFLFITLSLDV